MCSFMKATLKLFSLVIIREPSPGFQKIETSLLSLQRGPQGCILSLMYFSEKFSGHSFAIAIAKCWSSCFWLWMAWLQKVGLAVGMKSSTGDLPWGEAMLCDWDDRSLSEGGSILWPLHACSTFVLSLLKGAAISVSLRQLRSSWLDPSAQAPLW